MKRLISFGIVAFFACGSWYYGYEHYFWIGIKVILVVAASKLNFAVLSYRSIARKRCVIGRVLDMHDSLSINAGSAWLDYVQRRDSCSPLHLLKKNSDHLLVLHLQHQHWILSFIILHSSVNTIQSIQYFYLQFWTLSFLTQNQ